MDAITIGLYCLAGVCLGYAFIFFLDFLGHTVKK